MSKPINPIMVFLAVALTVSMINLAIGSREPAHHQLAERGDSFRYNQHPSAILKRSTNHTGDKHGHGDKHDEHHGHRSMMHNHLSRKVFDRACAASKDTIEEIVACINNESILKLVNPEVAAKCYKDAYGLDFNPKDIALHKDLICSTREKFEEMTACVYRKTAEAMNPKQIDEMTSAMVDVGLCIINALDG